MHLPRCLHRLALLLTLAWLAMAPAAHAADDTLRVGSKRFTESYILAELLAQTAAPHTASPPVVRQGLGNTAIVYEALRSGAIDLYAEYTGTIAQEILKGSPAESREAMNAALAPMGLGVAIPLGFNDGYALAVRAADADRLGLRTLSDLAKHPELKLGLSNEFIGRADGWKGLAERYGFKQTPTGLDHGLAYDAIAAKQIDAIDIYTTDAKIDHLGLRVLEDDRKYFPRYDAVVLYKLDLPQRLPEAWAALKTLEGKVDEHAMIAMNARAELQSVPFDAIARDFLAGAGKEAKEARRGFTAKLFGPDLWKLARQHLFLVALSVGIAILIGVPIAILVFPHVRLRAVVLGFASLLQTVPSLALLAVLISMLGAIGALPALIALTLYSLLPIMRNTVTGLAEVPNGLRLAGTALGMTPPQSLRLVLLPLALPTLLAGVRTATAIAIGTATIAAFIGAGGFGERIVTGLALNDRELLLAGALPAAALALVSEGVFELIEFLMRRGRRVSLD
ncbi:MULTISPECIES: glycine betaine ABC transporter substrate-binding protein [Variovorax]|jgi:osmoprotectant transport system permease protein|uniref:ABC transporter permease/substrate-binding protein n=1 Tax=Variovorax TaxID=34072 RepID=UPI00086F7483|nr:MULTISPECIES: glycine betaine ABC transporter substrate-binding protein [Variovorax]MBN8753533.1 ABC transporter permease subunit [Variovorax sp.]ODU12980.1 MAG: amino acid ABC transporter permease [Variovorax sp. SCN 67-85]ODV27514.1 MAG: amino acid ABC transporter permease [Variovorax sp. SCN 67-20]OJZ12205.1 MAG: amino acid ABC transporter permease [Variovorax sp. 67-131]UKI05957.1 ABC transporter permease subunit [Variovorax paradoxus]